MRRLIFFSGGVESTAFLTKANKNDLLVVMDPIYPNDIKSYNQSSVDSISTYFGMKVQYVKATIPVEPDPYNFVQQLHGFVALAHMWVEKDKSIYEVWTGRHLGEPVPGTIEETDRLDNAWKVLHPNVPWVRPLNHLTKVQQWKLIPRDVKRYVSSCIWHRKCGYCDKCVEFNETIGRIF